MLSFGAPPPAAALRGAADAWTLLSRAFGIQFDAPIPLSPPWRERGRCAAAAALKQIALAFVLGAVLAASGALAASTAGAAAKDSVSIGMTLEPPGLDPTMAAAAAIGEIVHYNIFEGLTKIKSDFSVTPLLAEKWSFSPDLKTLTLTLRKGVKFQDGEPFSSKDVKFSFERAAAKDSTNKDKAFFASIASIEASDPDVVTLTFKAPSYQALFHLGLNTAVILDEKSAATEATHPVGTGPYKLSAWSKGSSATLDKWDGFRDASKIAIARATFRFISDPSAQLAALLAGDVDAFPRFQAVQNLAQFQSDPRFQVTIGGTEGKTIVAINNKRSRSTTCACARRSLTPSTARRSSTASITAWPRRSAAISPQRSRLRRPDRRYPTIPLKPRRCSRKRALTTPLELTLIAAAAGLRAQGRRDRRRRTRRGRHPGENRGRRMGAVAVGRLQGQELRSDDHQPRRAARHRHLRQPRLLFPVRQPGFPRHLRQLDAAPDLDAFKKAIGEAQRKLADDCVNAFLFQLPTSRSPTRSFTACGGTRRSSPTICRRCPWK